MIIYRYISKQLFATTLGVSFVLVLIFFSGRFIKYLARAADGRIAGDALFAIMAYRLPGFLELILPLGIFLGILLAYGRLYLDSEMSVLQATGISQWQITKLTFLPAFSMFVVVALLSIYISPWGAQQSEIILLEAKSQSQLKIITPGKFHTNKTKDKVTYTETVSSDKNSMANIFMAEDDKDRLVSVVAHSGERIIDATTQQEYLQLRNGYRYEGQPGDSNFRVTQFDTYTVKLSEPEAKDDTTKYRLMDTAELWRDPSPLAKAEFQWRISLPILVPIVVLMAIPLSRVNPRQGRYLKLLPSIIGYLSYLSLLIAGKGWIEKGKIPPELGLWWIHGLFLFIAFLLHWAPNYYRVQKAKKGRVAVELAVK